MPERSERNGDKMYIANGIVVVDNPFENKQFIYCKTQRLKYDINEDMIYLLDYIKQNPSMVQKDLLDSFDGIEEVLDFLLKSGIITEQETDNEFCIKKVSDINSARLFIECTDSCNLSCPHCYGSFGNKKHNKLSIITFEKLLHKAALAGVYEVDITGGEPFMFPHIDDLFMMLYKYGMITTLFTNLTLCSEKHLLLIKEYGIKTVVTSIESENKEIHDRFRGMAGSLNKTVENIKWLVKNDIEVKVNYVLGNHNIADAQKNIDFICSLGVCCNIDVTTPEGRAEKQRFDLDTALSILRKYNNNSISQNCGVGKRMLFVASDGTLYPCPSIQEKAFSFGNIYDTYNLKDAFTKVIHMFSDFNCNNQCGIKECSGGCRARALHLMGAINKEDPYYCSIYERDKKCIN